jgi:hypothetical protein
MSPFLSATHAFLAELETKRYAYTNLSHLYSYLASLGIQLAKYLTAKDAHKIKKTSEQIYSEPTQISPRTRATTAYVPKGIAVVATSPVGVAQK